MDFMAFPFSLTSLTRPVDNVKKPIKRIIIIFLFRESDHKFLCVRELRCCDFSGNACKGLNQKLINILLSRFFHIQYWCLLCLWWLIDR
jgi:hypothetical protein